MRASGQLVTWRRIAGALVCCALGAGCASEVIGERGSLDRRPPAGGAIGHAVPPTSACAPESLCAAVCARGAFFCGEPEAVCLDACRFEAIQAGSCLFSLDAYFECTQSKAAGTCARDACASKWEAFTVCKEEDRNDGFSESGKSGADCCSEGFEWGLARTEDCDTSGACACYEEGVFKGTCQEWEGAHDPILLCGLSDGCCEALFGDGG